jgi:hypothetical protein
MGFLILSQGLAYREIGAIVAIVVAAGGASWTSGAEGAARRSGPVRGRRRYEAQDKDDA